MKTETLFAKIISYLFHPLLLPTIGLFLIFNLDKTGLWTPSADMQLYLYALTFLSTFLLPLLSAFILLKMNYISSLEMKTREERKLPYLITALSYFSVYYFMMNAPIPVLMKALMLGATVVVTSILIINLLWKISAHMAGIGGLCGMILAISYRMQINLHELLIVLFLAAGLIAFSRLKLNVHDSLQVYIGFILGISVQLILFL